MIYPIYLYGHPVLRKEAEPVEDDSPELKQLIEDMFATMYNSDGVGLAAPQIGLSKKLIVIDGNVMSDRYPECAGLKFALVNPELEVLADAEPVGRDEGCLSLPGISETVKRVEHVRLRWYDADGEAHDQEFTGFAARIIQHEYDHLLGKVYTDHVSPIRKSLIRSKLNNIIKGKVRCDYRTVAAPKH